MRKASGALILTLALFLAVLPGCSGKKETPPDIPRLENYSFNAASTLESRVGLVPTSLLKFFSRADGRADYAAYGPSDKEKALVMEYLRLLPPVYEKVFTERCIGIYFVSNFLGNGITSWVIGPGGKVYFYILLNPVSFKATLSETLTARERSCFIPAAGWDVSVDAGKKYKGMLYSLFHEGTHGLDYARGITPYTDDAMPEPYRPRGAVSGNFFLKTWEGYSKPLKAADFPGRDRLIFYGFGGGPKLPIAEAPAVYKGLAGSDFVSLYGARSWAEDIAELATFNYITGRLGQPYVIELSGPPGKHSLRPMQSRAGKRSAEAAGFLEKL